MLVVIDGLGRASTRLVDEVGVGEIMSGVSCLLCCCSREWRDGAIDYPLLP